MTWKRSSNPVRFFIDLEHYHALTMRFSPYARIESEQTTRILGLVVLRGPTITLLSPVDGHEEIANPFMAQE